VNVDEVRTFIRANHHGVLSTARSDGHPQLSPVSVGVDEDGKITISSRETAMKVKNLLRDPYASVCVFTDRFFGEWVQVEGRTEIVRLPEAMERLVEYYRSISGEHPDWDDYRQAMERDRRVMIRIEPERVGPNVSG
jgi:PPOX class probable F420-dependent enzyme